MIGIYSILNIKNNKRYIGSSKNIRCRWNQHKSSLKLGNHDNPYLQNSWNKYGESYFKFEILEITSQKELLEREQYYIDYYDFSQLYNIDLVARPIPRTKNSCKYINANGSLTDLCPKIGDKYNNLTVVSEPFKNRYQAYYVNCKCACGNIKEFQISNLVKNPAKNCGCDKSHCYGQTHNATSGKKQTPEYIAWKHAKEYSSRHTGMCEEWVNDFSIFLNDMGIRPSVNHVLGLIDRNKSYEKDNCEWTTLKIQNNNRKDTIYITYNDITKPLRYWAEEKNIKPQTLWNRIKKGWEAKRAIEEPVIIGKNQSYAKINNKII